jgi:hypothetical protein
MDVKNKITMDMDNCDIQVSGNILMEANELEVVSDVKVNSKNFLVTNSNVITVASQNDINMTSATKLSITTTSDVTIASNSNLILTAPVIIANNRPLRLTGVYNLTLNVSSATHRIERYLYHPDSTPAIWLYDCLLTVSYHDDAANLFVTLYQIDIKFQEW